jgi:hypothetical protein
VRRLSALLLVAVLAIAGCGGDDDGGDEAAPAETQPAPSEEPGTGGPTKEELIARADAICSQAKVNIDMARSQFHHGNIDQASTDELRQFVLDRIVPVYENALAGLSRLPDDPDLDEIVASGERATEELADDPLAISPRGGSALFDEANDLARGFGLSVCVAP